MLCVRANEVDERHLACFLKSPSVEVVIERTQTQSMMVAPVLLAVDVGVDEGAIERTKSALRALVTALPSTV